MDGRHHLHLRKRIYKLLESYPHPEALKRFLDKIMVFIAIAGPLATLPQVYQVFMTQDAKGLSAATWIIWAFLSVLWMLYGLVHKEMPIVISNLLSIILQATIIIGIFLYS